MSFSSTSQIGEITRLSQLIQQVGQSDSDIENIIKDLDAIQSFMQQSQAFSLRCVVSQMLLDPIKRTTQIWNCFEYGLKLGQAQPDPDLALELKNLMSKLKDELINLGLEQKVRDYYLEKNIPQN